MKKILTKQEIEIEFKKYKISSKGKHLSKHYWNLKDQQKVIRSVQAYKNNRGTIRCKVQLPQCYVNKKVRVIIVENDK